MIRTIGKGCLRAALGVLLLASVGAQAELRWSESFLWNQARVLSPGQNSWSFQTQYEDVNSRYGGGGQVTNLGAPYARTWSWNEIINGEQEDAVRADLKSYMKENGLRPDQIAAMSDFEIDRRETTFGLSWAYGLTENWMIGLKLPLTYAETTIKSTTKYTSGLGQALAHSAKSGTARASLSDGEMRGKVQSAIDSQLSSRGYDSVPERSRQLVFRDISLLSQILLKRTQDWVFSLQQFVRFPTAQNLNVADYIQMSKDEGQMDLGLTALANFVLNRWSFSGRVGYVDQLADSIKMRVPVDTGDGMRRIIERDVKRDLGDGWLGAIDAYYKSNRRLIFNAGYQMQFKSRDRYDGGLYSRTAYNRLEAGTDQQLYLTRIGVSYLMGKPWQRNGIEDKWITSLNIYTPLTGRNVSRTSSASLELRTYF